MSPYELGRCVLQPCCVAVRHASVLSRAVPHHHRRGLPPTFLSEYDVEGAQGERLAVRVPHRPLRVSVCV